MLIKERLAIPNVPRAGGSAFWLVISGLVATVLASLSDLIRKTFGLSVVQMITELAIAVVTIVLPATLIVLMATCIWHALKFEARRSAMLSGLALAPLIIFLLYAHLEMSYALAPLKIEFDQRVAATPNREGGSLPLTDLIKARDRYLAEYGYVRLGGWRTSGNESNCTAIYLFLGAF